MSKAVVFSSRSSFSERHTNQAVLLCPAERMAFVACSRLKWAAWHTKINMSFVTCSRCCAAARRTKIHKAFYFCVKIFMRRSAHPTQAMLPLPAHDLRVALSTPSS